MATVLVTDGEQRSALAVVRSLGRAGHDVHVCSSSGRSLAGASRHARSDTAVPHPLTRPGAFAEALRERVARAGAELLLPVTDASIPAVLEDPHLPGRVTVPLPDLEAYRAVSDKARLLEVAERAGVAVPRSLRLESADGAAGLALGELAPPYVLKPSRSVAGEAGHRTETGVSYARDRGELRSKVASLPGEAFPLLVQEYVEGVGEGVFLLRWGGETLGVFAHRRLREKPPSGGVSVYRESVAADPELVAASQRLLDAFGWRGVAMVEYKAPADGGAPRLMEVNGRFWGSLQLAVDAGVDFPALLVDAALGRDPAPVKTYRTGVRCRWWWGDVDHLLARLRGAAPTGNETREGRLAAVADFLVLWRPGDRSEVLRIGDPVPFLRETRAWIADALRGSDG